MTVSIVHASQPELTLDCLESLECDHSRRSSVEVVVLDNASGDDLATLVRERFGNIRVIEQAFRAGFSVNQNSVILATTSRYVFVLNPDTQVPSGTIDGLVDYLDTHPKAAVAGPLIRGFDGRKQLSALRLMTIPVQLVWALTLGQLGAVASRGTSPGPVGAVGGCAMLVSRDALERIGLFDEAYFAAGVARHMPASLRPASADLWDSRIYRLHARDAFRGIRDPSLRELAEEWNRLQETSRSTVRR